MSRIWFAVLMGGLLGAQTPAELLPPSDQKLLLSLRGKGSQLYVCQESKWVFKAPEAILLDEQGKPAGRHFAGPTWEATDGSQIKGKLVSSAPSPDSDSIPWLLLTVVAHSGSGVMTDIASVQRVNTKGGKAPAQACSAENDKQNLAIPYVALYRFYGSPRK